jgi:IS1 family transposase
LQCDEKWSFVYKKQRHCDPSDPADHHKGDCWDYVAYDPEHKLVLELIVGHRNNSAALALMRSVQQKVPRLPPAPRRKRKRRRISAKTRRRRERILFLATDGYTAYPRAVKLAFGSPPPPGLRYAVLEKHHDPDHPGRVVSVQQHPVFGSQRAIEEALANSPVSDTVNTAFLERHNATDRHRNARKVRRTYRFSKDWRIHQAASYFTYYTYNFCWCVRTLRRRRKDDTYRQHTPAMSAGLSDHIWSLKQWLTQIVTGLSG